MTGLWPSFDSAGLRPLSNTRIRHATKSEPGSALLLISPEKCEHEINGVKYFQYVLGSEDFNNCVAKSKFAGMPRFAKSDTGYIALQGDHGEISFRNIKIRPIAPTPWPCLLAGCEGCSTTDCRDCPSEGPPAGGRKRAAEKACRSRQSGVH